MQTMRAGFLPYKRGERTPGRSTAAVSTLDVLAERKVGRTHLVVTPCRGILHLLRGKDSDQVGYALVALGNASRETVYVGRWTTQALAEEAMQAYSPRYGLLGKH